VPSGTPAKAKQKLKDATERALKEPDRDREHAPGGFEPGTMRSPTSMLHQG